MAKVSKAQAGVKKKAAVDSVPSEMFPGKMIPKSHSNYGRKDLDRFISKPKAAAPKKKMKAGGKQMLKRADGSVSQRGLWDNIRAKKGSGKKPTAAMLKQERKIKAKGK